jgi:hypothetical protein
MARVKVHTPCMRPLAECDCPPDADDLDEPFEIDDGGDEDDAA